MTEEKKIQKNLDKEVQELEEKIQLLKELREKDKEIKKLNENIESLTKQLGYNNFKINPTFQYPTITYPWNRKPYYNPTTVPQYWTHTPTTSEPPSYYNYTASNTEIKDGGTKVKFNNTPVSNGI